MNEYRPDIDGLRMVAIVPVVLYHAGLPFLSGGYVGVDVFFVISGFLITRILHEEITQDRFSLVGFYERRVRRILPALIVVILATLLAGFMILPPEEFINLADSAIAASMFSSNFWFWIQTSDYFSSEAEFQLLLHTWSLAVEEQFYISFPILLWAISCWRKTITIWVVATLTVLSFLLAVIGVALDQPASFYLAPTRGWELGLGALLALGLSPPLTPRWVREVVAMAGFLAILTAIIFYDATTPFPGFAALLPCLGAAGLIWAGSQGRSLAGQVLSLEPVVSIGLLSYSLYLWHWPILAFLRLYVGDVNLSLSLASAGLSASLIAASLSWRYVERPFRRRAPDGFGRGQIFAFSGIATTAVLVLAVGISIGDGLPNRYTTDGIAAIAGGSDRNPDKERCFQIWPRSGLCRFGKETS
jgi:peptidoglycan/LPS O-acetylase OafA/YrhL